MWLNFLSFYPFNGGPCRLRSYPHHIGLRCSEAMRVIARAIHSSHEKVLMNLSIKRIVIFVLASLSIAFFSACSTTTTTTISVSPSGAASIATTPISRIRTFSSFQPDPLNVVGGGTLSSILKDFRLTIVETTVPNLQTVYKLKWAYHNVTQDDKNWTPLAISMQFFDSNGIALRDFSGTLYSPRDKCSYNPVWTEIEGTAGGPNYFDYIEHVKIYVHYSASYQGTC